MPVLAVIGGVALTTSLFPREGTYLLPLKVAVRRKLELGEGAGVVVEMTVGTGSAVTVAIAEVPADLLATPDQRKPWCMSAPKRDTEHPTT